MAYKEGSMGVALLVGFLVFLGLNAVLGMLIPFCFFGICISLGGYGAISGTVIPGWSLLFSGMFTMHFIGALFVPIIAGVLAGLIAKGGVTRGFIAGFVSGLVGYYISFLILFAVGMGLTAGIGSTYDPSGYGNDYGYNDYGYNDYGYGYDSSITGLAAQGPMDPGMGAQPMGGMGLGGDIVSWLLMLLVIPLIVGVLGGVGGAIIATIMAKPAAVQPPQPAVQTAPPAYAPPPQQPAQQPQYAAPQQQASPPPTQPATQEKKTAKNVVVCPNCGKENKTTATFCDGCGSRLKK